MSVPFPTSETFPTWLTSCSFSVAIPLLLLHRVKYQTSNEYRGIFTSKYIEYQILWVLKKLSTKVPLHYVTNSHLIISQDNFFSSNYNSIHILVLTQLSTATWQIYIISNSLILNQYLLIAEGSQMRCQFIYLSVFFSQLHLFKTQIKIMLVTKKQFSRYIFRVRYLLS